MSAFITNQITGMTYKQTQGIILDDKLITKEDFRQIFKDLLKDSESYEIFRKNLMNIKTLIHITQSKKGKQITTSEFVGALEYMRQIFSTFILKGFGGDINLLSTFNFTTKHKGTDVYFLENENNLPSMVNPAGAMVYENTKQNIDNLIRTGKNLNKLNQSLVSHLNGFDKALRDKNTQSKNERQAMYIWASNNMPDRWREQKEKPHPISIARYFWGESRTVRGYVAEAFGTHMALIHPETLMENHVIKLSNTVIKEHGGAGSDELFTLLHSTKGNISGLTSGDIVVIDGDGRVKFNIQSKASSRGSYSFTIAYQAFIKNLFLFRDVYENALWNGVSNKDIDMLFNKFSTNAWVPIKKKLENAIDETSKDLIVNNLKIK